MTITARYPGTCPACGGAIETGDTVEWERGSKARHTNCEAVPSRRCYRSCVRCGSVLDDYARRRGYRKCHDCGRPGGGGYMDGQSYYHRGVFVLGDDD